LRFPIGYLVLCTEGSDFIFLRYKPLACRSSCIVIVGPRTAFISPLSLSACSVSFTLFPVLYSATASHLSAQFLVLGQTTREGPNMASFTARLVLGLLGMIIAVGLLKRIRNWQRLRHIPGPFGAGILEWWHLKNTMGGRMHLDTVEACEKYGLIQCTSLSMYAANLHRQDLSYELAQTNSLRTTERL
jgi:hypothetical protein